jgi:hypothetical protein
VKQIKNENITFIKSKPHSMLSPHTSNVRLIEASNAPPELITADTSQVLLIVDLVADLGAARDDGTDSCASFDTNSEEIVFVRAVNFDDFDPTVGATCDMALLDSVNVNWDE